MSEGVKKVKRIMIVDDDLDMAPLYEYAGKVSDLIFAIKGGGLSALRHLNDINYDVDAVIIDLSMPDMDGLTLTEQIRRNESLRSKSNPIKIFWFTGWPFSEENPVDPITMAKNNCNVQRIFKKPSTPMEIIEEVKHQLNA